MAAKRVLSIGQCMADHGSISRLLRQQFNAEVVGVDSLDEALNQGGEKPFDLVLINRVLDADGSSGIAVLRQLKAEDAFQNVPVMLVSNHEDAQREAANAGALPGFGKAALGHPLTVERLRTILG